MDLFAQVAEKIIVEQENIIGPIALEQAKKVPGLSVDWAKHQINFSRDKTAVLNDLVKQYEHLFGQASVEACKEAVKNLISQVPQDQVPSLLK